MCFPGSSSFMTPPRPCESLCHVGLIIFQASSGGWYKNQRFCCAPEINLGFGSYGQKTLLGPQTIVFEQPTISSISNFEFLVSLLILPTWLDQNCLAVGMRFWPPSELKNVPSSSFRKRGYGRMFPKGF